MNNTMILTEEAQAKIEEITNSKAYKITDDTLGLLSAMAVSTGVGYVLAEKIAPTNIFAKVGTVAASACLGAAAGTFTEKKWHWFQLETTTAVIGCVYTIKGAIEARHN